MFSKSSRDWRLVVLICRVEGTRLASVICGVGLTVSKNIGVLVVLVKPHRGRVKENVRWHYQRRVKRMDSSSLGQSWK